MFSIYRDYYPGDPIKTGLKLGLTKEQVHTHNFGFHTIDAIKREMGKTKRTAFCSLDSAFKKYQGLNSVQIQGMEEVKLERENVSAYNFGLHTIDAIKLELKKDVEALALGRYYSCQSAFKKYQGLNCVQIEGVQLGLNREQVIIENFSCDTINAIKSEMAKGMSLNNAFDKYQGLTYLQIKSIQELGLNKEQTSVKNFDCHTIYAIKSEIANGTPVSNAFAKYQGLTCSQTKGVLELNLSREQVGVYNFDYHTISAIKSEMENGTPLSEAFDKYSGLNIYQIEAMQELGLCIEQVSVTNFYDYIIKDIKSVIAEAIKYIFIVEQWIRTDSKILSDVGNVILSFLIYNNENLLSIFNVRDTIKTDNKIRTKLAPIIFSNDIHQALNEINSQSVSKKHAATASKKVGI